MATEFGAWMRQARKAQGITQAVLAKRTGWSTTYICNIEKNGTHSTTKTPIRPSVEFVEDIATALGADIHTARLLAGHNEELFRSKFIDIATIPPACPTLEEDADSQPATRRDIKRLEHLLLALLHKAA